MRLYYNNERQNAKAAGYPFSIEVKNCDDLRKAVSHDHVCANYRDNYRKSSNFLHADCTMFDVDNTHSENPAEWISTEAIQHAFPNVPFYVCYSRNHMKEKNGQAARPKFHVYFPDAEIADAVVYSDLKHKVADYFPLFDQNAKDNARFFFGVANPSVEYFCGELPLSEFMKTVTASDHKGQAAQGGAAPASSESHSFSKTTLSDTAQIPVGKRNSTLLQYAGKVLTRYGDTEIAQRKYTARASCCEVPLESAEVEQIWASARKHFHSVIEQDPNYIPPERFHDKITQGSLKPSDYTDVGQAEVFFREYGEFVRYSEATRFLVYSTNVWVEDNIRAQGLVQELTRRQLEEARGLLIAAQHQEISAGEEGEDTEKKGAKKAAGVAKKYWKYILHSRESQRISAILKEARPKIQISPSDLDADRYLLNTPAGTVDLRTGQMKPHDPKDYCTKITTVSPANVGVVLFKDFLHTITCGDSELAYFLQQVAGMCAIGQVKCEKLIIAYGRGRNGKSTFFNLLARVLGTYSGHLSSELLTAKSMKNKGPELAELRGKRLVISSELEEGMTLNSAMVKKICSTDTIYSEKKYKDPFAFSPSHTLVLHTNHLPAVRADDDGTWRRLVVVPFDAVISPSEDKKDYAETLFTEAGDAVLQWIIDGAKQFIAKGSKLQYPKKVQEAINYYRADNDWLGNFLSACCEISQEYEAEASPLYDRYRAYCKENSETSVSIQIFSSALEQRGFRAKRTNSGRYRTGLRLKDITKDLPKYSLPISSKAVLQDAGDGGDEELVEF